MSDDLLDDPRLTAVGLFFEVHTGLNARFAAQLCEHGLSPVEFEVLMRLARSPDRQLRMTDLASQTSLSTSGVTRVADRMERDRYIARRACSSDRRSSYAVITQSGLTKLEQILPGHLALVEEWFTGRLPGDQLATVLDALRTIRDAVNPGATAGSSLGDSDRASHSRPRPEEQSDGAEPSGDAAERLVVEV
ncbi:MarR family winged helix-turn-helix transcriptional regulator [Phytohabitans flavus]|uniref:MarR family winged helix-turn-helix transcriptional regulator n=1 Tax=Phytohabitans flavus TaxID=1076124 RepID=UPI003638DB25